MIAWARDARQAGLAPARGASGRRTTREAPDAAGKIAGAGEMTADGPAPAPVRSGNGAASRHKAGPEVIRAFGLSLLTGSTGGTGASSATMWIAFGSFFLLTLMPPV
jgi:hypothetical protein